MIPFEGLIPYSIMFISFALGGMLMNAGITLEISSRDKSQYYGKDESSEEQQIHHYIKNRYDIDQWDKYFAMRDLRLTGSFRGQSDEPVLDESFKLNSIQFYSNTWKPWVLRKHLIMKNTPAKMMQKFSSERDQYNQSLKDDYIREMNGN